MSLDEITKRRMTRRDFLRDASVAAIGVVGASVLAACSPAVASLAPSPSASSAASGTTGPAPTANLAGTTLSVLCWEGYTDASFVKGFEDATGAKVNSTFIGSNDELVAKLRGGGASLYDLITPSCDTTNTIIDAGLAQAIDTSLIPNWQTAYPAFRTSNAVNSGGKLYGVPMCWGVIPLLVDTDKIPNPANSWSILWDPQYSGKISVWDDISTIYNTALLLGYSNLYSLDDTQLEAIRQKLVAQKPLVRKYWATAGELTNLFASGEVTVANSFGGLTYTQLSGQGKHMKEFVPKEGATAWVDYWMITKSAKNVAGAHAFLNHIHAAATQQKIFQATGYGPTNQDVVSLLDAATVSTFHLDDPSFLANLSYWQQVPQRAKYISLLNEVKSA
jgi:spermidine/putrescine-binding protein